MKYRSETNNPKLALGLISSRLLLALVVSASSYFGVVELASAEGKDTLYRYRDEKGRVVMANQIPPEYVKFGYSILNRHGQVIKEVPRAPTEEELRAMEAAGTVKAEVEAQKRRQQAEDAQLLRTFSSAEDAERAMERKLAALDVIIDITKGNISRLNIELENDQIKAANIERSGGEVPNSIMTNIDNLSRQIEEAETFIVEKDKEKNEVHGNYSRNIERLKELGR